MGRKQGDSKKGLSPIIASALLIFLVLVLAAIVFLWASGFFAEQLEKNGESVETLCSQVKMQAGIAGGFKGQRLVEFEITNEGDIDLYGVSIKESRAGNDIVNFFPVNLAGGEGTVVEVNIDSAASEKIFIYPVLLGNVVGGNDNKEFTCIETPTIITL